MPHHSQRKLLAAARDRLWAVFLFVKALSPAYDRFIQALGRASSACPLDILGQLDARVPALELSGRSSSVFGFLRFCVLERGEVEFHTVNYWTKQYGLIDGPRTAIQFKLGESYSP